MQIAREQGWPLLRAPHANPTESPSYPSQSRQCRPIWTTKLVLLAAFFVSAILFAAVGSPLSSTSRWLAIPATSSQPVTSNPISKSATLPTPKQGPRPLPGINPTRSLLKGASELPHDVLYSLPSKEISPLVYHKSQSYHLDEKTIETTASTWLPAMTLIVPLVSTLLLVLALAFTKKRNTGQSIDAPVPSFMGRDYTAIGMDKLRMAMMTVDVEDAPIELPTSDESDALLRIRHSSAHIMAMAVQRLYPDAKVTIGPWIERGFYYDFDMKEALSDADLKKIEKEISRITRENLPFVREEVTVEEAERRIRAINEPYKLEILESIVAKNPDAPITIYHIGEKDAEGSWWDLCAGPHVEHTGKIRPKALKLETVAGAYWRGDEQRPMLQRIYGTAWETKEQLKAYQNLKEEAAKRDHRKLGKELELFSLQEEAGGGLVLWHPNGAMVRNVMETYWKDVHIARGYKLLYTPHVAKIDLWKTSGHFDFYNENMYTQMDVENEEYQLRPMNCPFHILVYKDNFYSYRDLPLRWAELGTVYRYERSGTMHGLFRVRGFTQDDAHIFCTPDQIEDEIRGVLDLAEELLGSFGFTKYEVNLSTRPDKSVGSDGIWSNAESALSKALGSKGWDFVVDEGGGAFYGPKIDIKIQDAIGRKWQCATVQLDFNLPERFEMDYIDSDNVRQRPIMIHRAILGSIERFFGILTENYAGAFPLWMAPTQVRMLPVTIEQESYCEDLLSKLQAMGIRADIDKGQRLGKLVRNAELSKIPVMCVVGKKEAESNDVTIRTYLDGDLGTLPVESFIEKLVAAIKGHENFSM